LFGHDDFSFKYFSVGVSWHISLSISPVELDLVQFEDRRPLEPIVHVEPIDFVFVDDFEGLGYHEVPSLFLSVVEGSSIIITDRFAIGSVVVNEFTMLVNCSETEIFIAFGHTARTDPDRTVHNDFDTKIMSFIYQFF
jgi:hypothetical protein